MRTDPITSKQRSTGCRDLDAARLVRAARERAASDPAYAAETSARLSTECRRFMNARAEIGKAGTFYEQKLGHWCRIFGDAATLRTVGTPGSFDAFVSQRRAEGASDHTISKEVRCALTVLRFSKRSGLYAGDLSVLRPTDLTAGYVPRKRALSPSELVALLGDLAPERWAFVALIVGLGLRRGEAMAITPAHVDLVRGIVSVPGTKTAGARRDIPVLTPFLGIVTKAAASLPLAPWGNYLRDLRVACKHAGIEPVTANDLRRTHATLLRQAGVERDVVRRLLGHSPGSAMLETVYDQPKPLELAERAGDMSELSRALGPKPNATVTRHCLPGPTFDSCRNTVRAREDSNLRPTAPEAQSPTVATPAISDSPADSTPLETRGVAREPVADATGTRHSLAALALAVAAEQVFARARSRAA